MKKVLFYYFSFIILCMFINVSLAKAYKCTYDAKFPNNDSKTGAFVVDENKIKIEGNSFDWLLDTRLNSNFSEIELVKTLDGGCPRYVYVCSHFTTWSDILIDGVTSSDRYSFIINGDLINNFSGQIDISYSFSNGYASYITTVYSKDCVIASVNEDKTTAPIKNDLFSCSYYDIRIDEINKLDCNDKNSNCDAITLTKYNKLKKELQVWCNTLSKYADYVNPCLKKCLLIKNEPGMNDEISNDNYQCGFSERLILWIANIIRWVKYIVPVAVIVLGMLDFMKAISADKEDEMKKAQQRFIRRLIAAALIFIAPFIIEFVLNKLGFGANGCGIINL